MTNLRKFSAQVGNQIGVAEYNLQSRLICPHRCFLSGCPPVFKSVFMRQLVPTCALQSLNSVLLKNSLIAIFALQYFAVVSPLLLHDLFAQLQWCIQQDNEQLARYKSTLYIQSLACHILTTLIEYWWFRSGISCLENLVLSNGSKFNAESWDSLCQCLHDVFSSTTPSQLLTWKPLTGGYSRPPSVDPALLSEIDGDIGHPPPRLAEMWRVG